MSPKEDLDRSGLSIDTIRAMRVRAISGEELQRSGWQSARGGYIIPYFNWQGEVLPDYFRIKLLPSVKIGGTEVKYIQPSNSITHAYLPPNAPGGEASWRYPDIDIYVTEGEKKAAAGCQRGLLTLGFGGADSWRCRTVVVKPEKITTQGDKVVIKIESGIEASAFEDTICPELREIPWEGRRVHITYDSDSIEKPNVQRAIFEFAIWVQGEGAKVDQVMIPHKANPGKMGLDDYLLENLGSDLSELGRTFPRHPKPRSWIRRKLDDKKIVRSDVLKCARAIIYALDAGGQRYSGDNGDYYYWDTRTNILHAFRCESQEVRQIRLSTFGDLLQEDFGVGASDEKLVSRVADLFTSGEYIRKATPKKVSWCTDDTLYYQLSDSFVAKVDADGIQVVDNGVDGALFLADQVEPISIPPDLFVNPPPEPLWMEALEGVNLNPLSGLTIRETRVLITSLYYLSPLFRGWRGMMLPIELLVAEPGSGKTYLCNLRKAVLTGRATLDNPPPQLKDWYASIAAASGIWICDNIGEGNREVREQISDELARLVTDPDPKVAMRRLYTTNDQGLWPVDCCFAFTSIRAPFWKPDILQRSLAYSFSAIPSGKRDARWYRRRIEGEGRALRVVDMLWRAHLFLKEVRLTWDPDYLSQHRLVHFEQAMMVMGRVLGFGEEMEAIVGKLQRIVQDQVVDADPVIGALKMFAQEWSKGRPFRVADIVNWAAMDVEERFEGIRALKNSVSLGKYITSHTYDIEECCGIKLTGQRQSQNIYEICAPPSSGDLKIPGKPKEDGL